MLELLSTDIYYLIRTDFLIFEITHLQIQQKRN